MVKIALVTGSSSGIGFETSLALARNGFYTFASMRDVKKSKEIKAISEKENLDLEVLALDVDSEESVNEAMKTILKKNQRIDILVNNAGYGMWGTVEDVSVDEFKEQFETNFFSVIRMIHKVAPIMRARFWLYCKCEFCCRKNWISSITCIHQFKICIRRVK